MFKLSSFCLELIILLDLLFNLFSEFTLHRLDSINTFVAIKFELGDLHVKTLLVVFLLLYMFTLDDLLSLLGNSVELNIFSTFLEVSDLKLKTLVLIHNLLEERLILKDVCHILNFSVTTILYG
jgi:hypothetical protein